jgi:conjugative relaxase-like TrwC/TraI family protein
VADEETKAVIYDCHRRAIDIVVGYAEREVFHSRSGTNGIVQEDIVGVIAASFTHWDSRAGDPQLHDHVVVLNRAKSNSSRPEAASPPRRNCSTCGGGQRSRPDPTRSTAAWRI